MNVRERLRFTASALARQAQAFPWEDAAAYGDFLAQTYYYVCHSTRLLAWSAARFTPTQEKLHWRFLAHCREEGGHQQLAKKDLESLGFTLADFPERAATRSFYEIQYAKSLHSDPTALLGYVLALETFAAASGPWIYARAKASHGEKCGAFLKVHSEDDPEHVAKALQALEGLDERQLEIIEQNIEQSGELYRAILMECAESASVTPRRRAA